jgi:hypothetical protein
VKDSNFNTENAIKVTEIKLDNKYKPFTNEYNNFLEEQKEKITSLKEDYNLSWNIQTRNDNCGNKIFEFTYNITKDGFRVNKEINYIIEHLKMAIKCPLTCGFLIKLSSENIFAGNPKISFE